MTAIFSGNVIKALDKEDYRPIGELNSANCFPEDDDDAPDIPAFEKSTDSKESKSKMRGEQVKSRSAERASSVPVPQERRSARLNKESKTSPLREIVDHRLSRLQKALRHSHRRAERTQYLRMVSWVLKSLIALMIGSWMSSPTT